MPTLPPEPPAPHEQRPSHEQRRMAESFGVDPGRYDRHRPGYPAELVSRVVALSPGPEVLDVGCGTGIAARQFQEAGCRVVGVDPDARMAAYARGRGLDVEVSTFEDWDPAGRSFAAVVAGQAWHWVDPVAGVAKAGQVLRPGGVLAIFNHVFQNPPEVNAVFAELFPRIFPDSPIGSGSGGPDPVALYQTMFTRTADHIRDSGGFGEPEQRRFDWSRAYGREDFFELLATQGGLTSAPPEKVAEFLAGMDAALIGDSFTVSYATLAVVAVCGD